MKSFVPQPTLQELRASDIIISLAAVNKVHGAAQPSTSVAFLGCSDLHRLFTMLQKHSRAKVVLQATADISSVPTTYALFECICKSLHAEIVIVPTLYWILMHTISTITALWDHVGTVALFQSPSQLFWKGHAEGLVGFQVSWSGCFQVVFQLYQVFNVKPYDLSDVHVFMFEASVPPGSITIFCRGCLTNLADPCETHFDVQQYASPSPIDSKTSQTWFGALYCLSAMWQQLRHQLSPFL